MVNTPPPAEPGRPPADRPGPRVRIAPKYVLAAVIAAATVWFVFANTRHGLVTFWWKTVSAPMWIVLLGTFLAGALTGWLLRRRRRG